MNGPPPSDDSTWSTSAARLGAGVAAACFTFLLPSACASLTGAAGRQFREQWPECPASQVTVVEQRGRPYTPYRPPAWISDDPTRYQTWKRNVAAIGATQADRKYTVARGCGHEAAFTCAMTSQTSDPDSPTAPWCQRLDPQVPDPDLVSRLYENEPDPGELGDAGSTAPSRGGAGCSEAACASASDCCRGACVHGACACAAIAAPCDRGPLCCSGLCSEGRCACAPAGALCTGNEFCCSGACSSGTCS